MFRNKFLQFSLPGELWIWDWIVPLKNEKFFYFLKPEIFSKITTIDRASKTDAWRCFPFIFKKSLKIHTAPNVQNLQPPLARKFLKIFRNFFSGKIGLVKRYIAPVITILISTIPSPAFNWGWNSPFWCWKFAPAGRPRFSKFRLGFAD